MGLSNYLERALLDQLLREQAPPGVAETYVGILTSITGDGDGFTEPVDPGYARALAVWRAPVDGSCVNDNDLSFGPFDGSQGTLSRVALFDAPSGGRILWHGVLAIPRRVSARDVAEFPAGSLTISLR